MLIDTMYGRGHAVYRDVLSLEHYNDRGQRERAQQVLRAGADGEEEASVQCSVEASECSDDQWRSDQ